MKNMASVSDLILALSQNLSAAELKTAFVTSEISSRIIQERVSRGMTQTDFAALLGVSQPMVSKWESGDYNFTIAAISEIFDKLNLDYSFNIIDEKATYPAIVYESNANQAVGDITNYYESIHAIA